MFLVQQQFWICGSSFQQAFKLLLVPCASLDLDVQFRNSFEFVSEV